MTTSITTNSSAAYAQSNLRRSGNEAARSIARLSSGQRITRAADDVAALSIGTALATDVSTFKIAALNANQASSLLQVADGGLANITTILQRQKALAVQANSGTLSAQERSFLNQEFANLTNEIDRLVDNTNFNGITLLDGTAGAATASFNVTAPTVVGSFTYAGTFSNALAVDSDPDGNAATLDAITFAAVDADLIGSFANSTFTAVYNFDGANNTTFSIEINGDVYTSDPQSDPIATGTTITFLAASGGSFSFDTGTSNLALGSQVEADAVAQAFNEAFAGVTIYQQRAITNFQAPVATSVMNGFVTGDTFIQSDNFDTTNATLGSITEFTVRSVTEDGANDAVITAVINGSVYVLDNTTVTYTSANQIDVSATTAARLVSADDSNDFLQISFANVAADIDIESAQDATLLKNALDFAYNVSANEAVGANGGLNFQVGTTTSDTISVNISNSNSSVLYGGTTLDVLTTASAQSAIGALDTAINTVTSIRAEVGALQSRFDFASANLETSIQNVDAARGVLMDTDISTEATNFAAQQVLLQASISVLAQANQLPQNLLNLLS